MKGVRELLLKQNGVLLLDGALGTAIQSKGFKLDHELWSAHLIKENPQVIQNIHQEYYEAGADIVTSASYQASVDLFMKNFKFNSVIEAERQISKSVDIAQQAKRQVSRGHKNNLLVAASIGPYGACLGDGGEYHGQYGIKLGEKFLEDWHRKRFEILVDRTNADILAIETIPSLTEVRSLLNLLPKRPNAKAWISVSCTDDQKLRSGEKFTDFIKTVESQDKEGQVDAIGVNCTPPKFIPSLIKQIRSLTSRAIIVYPNNGNIYDSERRVWHEPATKMNPLAFANQAIQWKEAGSPIIIGGCCMTDRNVISAMSRSLRDQN